MATPAEIDAQIRAEHPFFTVSEGKVEDDGIFSPQEVTISPASDPQRYEAMVAERVAWRLEQQQQETAQADENTRAEQAKTRYAALKAGTATAKQTQEVVAYLLRQQHRDLEP